MATLPLSYTKVKIISGVNWTNDYKNSRFFSSKDEQLEFFNSKPIIYENNNHSFAMNNGRHHIAIGGGIYDKLLKSNYLMFQNSEYTNKWFYAFVTKIERVNAQVTHVYFELDLLQTWLKDFTMKPSFVVREHCKLWNDDGSPVVNTVDEGLNYGLEYDDVHIEHFVPNENVKFLVIITKSTIHGDSKDKHVSTYNGMAQPLSFYIMPITLDGEGLLWISDDGDEIAMSEPEKLLSEIYKDEKATNNIVSIYLTNSIGCPFTISGGGESFKRITFTEKDHKFQGVKLADKVEVLYVKEVKRYKTETFDLGSKYNGLPQYKESKLYMYPYSVLTLDDFKGNRHDYKYEYMYDSNIKLNMKGSMGTSNKVSYGIQKYNDKANMTNHQDNQYALFDNTPQDIPVITDMLSAFFQGNRNSLQNQKNSIEFNGAMNLLGSGINGVQNAMNPFQTPIEKGLGVASSVTNVVKGAGNTVLQLQGLEAKQADIANMPNQLSKQGSNTAYDTGHRYDGVTFIKKTLKTEYRRKLEHFFNMFGYKVNEVKIPNFHTRKNWNYVQTTSCNINGDFNNEDLQELKSIFDGGITLWHTNDIGNYDLDNSEI